MSLQEIITIIVASSGATVAIIYFLLKKIIDASIARSLERYKKEIDFEKTKLEKSALVAELLSEWKSKPEDKTKLNRLLWEASLWLPDEEAININNLLAHETDITLKQMIIKIRNLIHKKETKLTNQDLTSF